MSDNYDALIAAAEQKYGIPQGLLLAQKGVESGGNAKAVSPKGAIGLMQLMPATARTLGVDPTDPVQSIDGAARLMATNLKQANGDPTQALRLYQGGPNQAGWGGQNHAYPAQVYRKMGAQGSLLAMGLSTPGSDPGPIDGAPPHSLGQMGLQDTGGNVSSETLADMGATPPGQTTATANDKLTTGIQPYLAKGDETGAMNFLSQNGKLPKDPAAIRNAIASYKQYGPNGVPVVETQPKPATSDSTLTNLKAGGDMGLQDVLEGGAGKLGQYVEGKIPALRTADQFVGNLLNSKTADQLASDYAQHKQLFDATAGNTFAGQFGRVGGNILATAPLMAAGGSLLGAGGRLAAAAAPDLEMPLGFLAGNGGRAVAANEAAGTAAVPGNMLVRAGSLATNGAIQGGTAGALTSAQSDAPLLDQIESGAKFGGILAPAAGAVGAIVNKITNAVAPKLDAGTAALADLAMNKYGIDMRGSQITANPLLKRWDAQHTNSVFSDFSDQNANQKAQFTRAVGNTFGADSDTLSPEVMTAAKNKISDIYNGVAGRTQIDVNPEAGSPFLDNVSKIASDAKAVVGEDKIPAVGRLVDNVLSKVGPDGTLSGEQFKALTQKGSMLDRAASSSDPSFAATAKAIKGELNGALESSATKEDATALKQADWQWKNMRTVEKAIGPDGQINPALLQGKVNTSFKNRVYSGAGDLGELGQIGQVLLKPPSSSGTVENARAEKMFSYANTGTGIGLGALAHAAGMPMGLDIAAGGLMAGRGALSAGGNALAAKMFGTPAYANKLIASATAAPKAGNPAWRQIMQNGLMVGGNDLMRLGSSQPAR